MRNGNQTSRAGQGGDVVKNETIHSSR
jgi:hypothetical protein